MLRDDYGGELTTLPFAPMEPRRGAFFVNEMRHSQTLDRLDHVNREAARLIDAGGYDAALVDACRFTFAPQLLRHLRTPSLYYCHHGPWRTDGLSELSGRSAYENVRHLAHAPFRRQIESRIRSEDRELTRSAKAVATNSAFSQARLRETSGVDAHLCPPGIEVPPRRSRHNGGYVLTVGDLVPHKGHDLVVRALATMSPAVRPRLHIIGNGGGRAYHRLLIQLARGLGVDLEIRVGISDAELAGEYQAAELFAFGARREPLGLAPLEAMANGLAVVGVDEGGVTETVINQVTGYLVPAVPEAFGERIGRLMADAPMRQAMGDAGRTAVKEKWSRDVRTAALERVLLRVAAMTPLVVT
jgi:glycosyltransferase involved in cell wall biosynthesis